MKMTYKLNLEIEGANWYEIADALTKAAADPLIARIAQGVGVIKTHVSPPPGPPHIPKGEENER